MRRLSAIAALVLLVACAVVVVVVAARSFPRGLVVAAIFLAAVLVAWAGIRRRGAWRIALLSAGAALLVAAIILTIVGGVILEILLAIACLLASMSLATRAFAVRTRLPPAARPQRPVVIWNPKSGGGKALAANLADEARARGIEPIELRPGR